MACWRLGAQRHLASRLAPLITKLWLPPPCLQADSELDKQRRAEWRPGCYVRVHGHISNFGGLLLALLPQLTLAVETRAAGWAASGLGTAKPAPHNRSFEGLPHPFLFWRRSLSLQARTRR